ncbi:hypothetical protein LX32DRAFT_338135 [Colletotrichum zoysiae]|uniref:Uncharacterized protein n=1 Tax=Colletotrichum zoysiae TaxID=1216348 RepID=A0AAD9HLM2_9PEZI|nr:hypothetical protein LX32DRAFT_338135 [Colletotrichum zoysiae]
MQLITLFHHLILYSLSVSTTISALAIPHKRDVFEISSTNHYSPLPQDIDFAHQYLYIEAAAKRANAKLRNNKWYYALQCFPGTAEVREKVKDDEGIMWIASRTKTAKSPQGCIHVALVVGVTGESRGKKTFKATDIYPTFIEQKKWTQQHETYKAMDSFLIYGGTTSKKNANVDRLLKIGQQWINKAPDERTSTYNGLTYYWNLVKHL